MLIFISIFLFLESNWQTLHGSSFKTTPLFSSSGAQLIMYLKQAVLAPSFRQLSSDWLPLICRKFKQHVGGASVLTARSVPVITLSGISALSDIIQSQE